MENIKNICLPRLQNSSIPKGLKRNRTRKRQHAFQRYARREKTAQFNRIIRMRTSRYVYYNNTSVWK